MKRNKHNILIVASPWLGGSGSLGCEMSEILAARGHKVAFLSYSWPFKADGRHKNWEYFNVKPYEYSLFPFPLYELALVESIVDTVLKNDINIIHAHYGILFGHAALVARSVLRDRGRKVKVVVTFHGSDALGFDFENPGSTVPRYLNNWTLESADAITVASENLRDWFNRIYSLKREIEVIPNFINAQFWKTDNKKGKRRNLVHISNFRKVKRALNVIKIYESVMDFVSEDLYMLGEGPELRLCKDYVIEKEISNRITFLGKQDASGVRSVLEKSGVLMLPSQYENCPLSALEAQACGVPVIASDIGGFREIIIDGKTGFFISGDDFDGFKNKTLKLLENGKLWLDMSVNSVKNSKKFAIATIMAKYEKIYQHL